MDSELQCKSAMRRDLTFHFLEHITNKFSKDRIIGYGAYGVVYKGVLDNGEEIAVKRLKHLGIDNDKQFKNECTNLMRLQHKNIVRLVGYCYEIAHIFEEYKGNYVPAGVEEKVLCFEYMRGGSLDKHLSDESCGLGWHKRYKIIKGICEGLHYLHNGSKDPIYHLDLKPANILLDKNMVPKIGDFGLSRLVDSTHTCTTTGIIGTPGYMPPEYINRYQITPKFDVFSLGVILIQVMAGREGYSKCGDMASQEFIYLVCENWEKRLHSTMYSHTSHEIKTCIEIALRCVEVDRVKRPTIAEIVDELNKIDTVERSLLDQVKLQRNQASYKYMNSGAADAESALTASSSPPTRSNPMIKYGDEGSSSGTTEEEHKPLEQKQLEEDPSEYYKTQDPGRRSGRTVQRFRSVWAGVWPTLKATSEGRDGLFWWHDLARCQDGDLSVAAMQANNLMEDQCLVESALPLGTIVGVFDGHGGPEASRFIRDQFLANLQEAASGPQGMSADAIRNAFLSTEQGFITLVSNLWETRPSLAAVGSCCLVGIVHQGTLFVANLGDSRAVLGKISPSGKIVAEQLSREHNASKEDVRRELSAEHPDDPHIVVLKHNVWRVKGIIQLSRSIGDAFLKYPQYNMEPLHSTFRLRTPFSKPLLSANPSIVSLILQPSDHFVIFASDGFWEHLSNQEAIEIVQKHQRAEGCAKRLIKAAVQEAALKREMTYKDICRIDRGVRRHFHDDITVIVLFLNHPQIQPLSIRCPLGDGR